MKYEDIIAFHNIQDKNYEEIIKYILDNKDISKLALHNLFNLLISRKLYNNNITKFLDFIVDNNYMDLILSSEFLIYFEKNHLLVLNVLVNELNYSFQGLDKFNEISKKIILSSKLNYHLYDFAFAFCLRHNIPAKTILKNYDDDSNHFELDIKFYQKLDKKTFLEDNILHLEIVKNKNKDYLDYFLERVITSSSMGTLDNNKVVVFKNIDFNEYQEIIDYSNYHIKNFLPNYKITPFVYLEDSEIIKESESGLDVIGNDDISFNEKLYIIDNFLGTIKVFGFLSNVIKPLVYFVFKNIDNFEDLKSFDNIKKMGFLYFNEQFEDYYVCLKYKDLLYKSDEKIDVIQVVYKFKDNVEFKTELKSYILNNTPITDISRIISNLTNYFNSDDIEYVLGQKTIDFLIDNFVSLISNRFDENYSRLLYNDNIKYILSKHSVLNDNIRAFIEFYDFDLLLEEQNSDIIKFILDNENNFTSVNQITTIKYFRFKQENISKAEFLDFIINIFNYEKDRYMFGMYISLIIEDKFNIIELNNSISNKYFVLGASIELYFSDLDTVEIDNTKILIELINNNQNNILLNKKLLKQIVNDNRTNKISILEYYLKETNDIAFVKKILNLSLALDLDVDENLKKELFFLLDNVNKVKEDIFSL